MQKTDLHQGALACHARDRCGNAVRISFRASACLCLRRVLLRCDKDAAGRSAQPVRFPIRPWRRGGSYGKSDCHGGIQPPPRMFFVGVCKDNRSVCSALRRGDGLPQRYAACAVLFTFLSRSGFEGRSVVLFLNNFSAFCTFSLCPLCANRPVARGAQKIAAFLLCAFISPAFTENTRIEPIKKVLSGQLALLNFVRTSDKID